MNRGTPLAPLLGGLLSVRYLPTHCHGVWAGTLVPPTSMDSANHTRLWVGLGLQWGPGTTTPKGATPLQPCCSPSSSFLFSLPCNST